MLAVSPDTCIHYSIICLYRMFKSVFQICLHSSVPAIVIPIYFLSLNLFSCSSPPVTQAPSLDRITIFITLSHSFSLHAPCRAAGKQNAALPFTAVYQSYVSISVQHLAKFRITLYSKISKEPCLQLFLLQITSIRLSFDSAVRACGCCREAEGKFLDLRFCFV